MLQICIPKSRTSVLVNSLMAASCSWKCHCHMAQSSGPLQHHAMGCAQTSCIQPGLITIWFSQTWTIKDSSQKLYVNTQWQCAGGCKYSGLGSSQRNTLQIEYADLCITGISVWTPVVIFLNNCGAFTCCHPQMGFSCTCFILCITSQHTNFTWQIKWILAIVLKKFCTVIMLLLCIYTK